MKMYGMWKYSSTIHDLSIRRRCRVISCVCIFFKRTKRAEDSELNNNTQMTHLICSQFFVKTVLISPRHSKYFNFDIYLKVSLAILNYSYSVTSVMQITIIIFLLSTQHCFKQTELFTRKFWHTSSCPALVTISVRCTWHKFKCKSSGPPVSYFCIYCTVSAL
jgi:hypothetical protein